MKNYIIFGAPGAGKGTQAKMLAQKHGLVHLSSGEILRHEIAEGDLGPEIQKYLTSGRLVPGDLINAVMDKAIASYSAERGFIFDGYPRTLGQAKHLDQTLKKIDRVIDAVLKLRINEEEGIKRIIKRAKTSGRSDDNRKVIKERFRIYRQEMDPLIAYYQSQKKMLIIDGLGTVKQIASRINKRLSERNKKDRS